MHRRTLARAAAGAAAIAALPVLAEGGNHVAFTPQAYAAALASGEPFLLDFYAPW